MNFNVKFAIHVTLLLLAGCQAAESTTSEKNFVIEETRDFYFNVRYFENGDWGPSRSVYVGHVASPSEICERLRHPIFQDPYFEAALEANGSSLRWRAGNSYVPKGNEQFIFDWLLERGSLKINGVGMTGDFAFGELSRTTSIEVINNISKCLEELDKENNSQFNNIDRFIGTGRPPEPTGVKRRILTSTGYQCYKTMYINEEYVNNNGDIVNRRIVDQNHKKCGHNLANFRFRNYLGQILVDKGSANGLVLLLGLREGKSLFDNILDREMPNAGESENSVEMQGET